MFIVLAVQRSSYTLLFNYIVTSLSAPFKPETIRQNWLSNVPADLLAGTVVALALIPKAIAFSLIAKVPPTVGLYASLTMAVTIAFVGGRPGGTGHCQPGNRLFWWHGTLHHDWPIGD